MCEALAVLFAVPASHCVDDMIGIDLADIVMSGWKSWRAFAKVSGWEVGDDKSPPPSQRFLVIGVDLDMSATPVGPAVLSISEKRVAVLTQVLLRILSTDRLAPGEASSLTGKLGFALCAVFGRIGRTQLRPINDRACHRHKSLELNSQLRSCVAWWIKFLQTYITKEHS